MKNLVFAILLIMTVTFVSAQGPEESTVEFDQQEMLELVNEARLEKRRCGGTRHDAVEPLEWNEKLAKAAQKHADDMATNDFFAHTGSDKSSVVDRVEREDFLWRTVGENVAMGPPSVSEVVKGWLDSPGHCSNIMNGEFTEMGAALSHDGKYWVQVFGAPRE
ncbi:CAP domain-containing protein [Marinilabilia rubra]|uniref:CAP domain-containing protein n=1 Tax=Marinilabilia rubra TaxID=2162893 RepID=A0A2U2BBK6_9BACT|nr:CAP domain-containing protein [Marinilabilia rubra]PWE00446.1 CAP domain-containing protein [Marinilabilia rubra]